MKNFVIYAIHYFSVDDATKGFNSREDHCNEEERQCETEYVTELALVLMLVIKCTDAQSSGSRPYSNTVYSHMRVGKLRSDRYLSGDARESAVMERAGGPGRSLLMPTETPKALSTETRHPYRPTKHDHCCSTVVCMVSSWLLLS